MKIVSGVLCLLGGAAWAQEAVLPFVPPEREVRFEVPPKETLPPFEAQVQSGGAVELSGDELLAQPDLLHRALDSALVLNDRQALAVLLPIYRRLPSEKQDAVLPVFAQARADMLDGRWAEAAAAQRAVLRENPDFAPVRMDLLHALLRDRRNREAAEELAVLRETPDLPPHIAERLDGYEQSLRRQNGWQWNAGLNYLHDENVNNAPNVREVRTVNGTWTLPEPQRAHGAAYTLSADKTTPLRGHWAWQFSAETAGKFYWDNHAYDDLLLHGGISLLHRTDRQEWQVRPFYEQRWFGTEPYSRHYGAAVGYGRRLSAHWHGRLNVQYGRKIHRERRFLDGGRFRSSAVLSYMPSEKQRIRFAADWTRENAAQPDSAYRSGGMAFGWQRQWTNGAETALHLNAAFKRYDAPDWFLYDRRRKDREYGVYVSVGHRKLQWKGLMPKLAWTWTAVRSNHLFYRSRKQQVFVEIGSSF